MLYSMSEYMLLSFIYNQVGIVGDLPEQLFYRNIIAQSIARSVSLQTSLFTDTFSVFKAIKLPRKLPQSLPFSSDDAWEKTAEFFKEFTRYLTGMHQHEKIQEIVQKELMLCAEKNIRIVCLEDQAYPEKLRQTLSPSPVLYVKGEMPSFQDLEQSVALIGMHDPDGEHAPSVALGAASALQEKNWWNISGLAKGCDTLGHIASLQLEGKTGAVVPFGLAGYVEPLENTLLAEAIVDQGGFLMSERFPSRPANRLFSVLRNRIQSALTTALFVIETDYASGTMVTVDESLKLKKTVFVYDPVGENLPPENMIEGNRLLLSLKHREKEAAFQFDSYQDTHIVGVSSLSTFYEWLSYMNGDQNEDRLHC